MSNYDKFYEALRFHVKLVGLEFAVFNGSFWENKVSRIIAYLFFYSLVLFGIVDIAAYTTRFMSIEDLVKLVVNTTIVLILSMGVLGFLLFVTERKKFSLLIESMRNLHKAQLPCLKPIYKRHFDRAYQRLQFVSKFLLFMGFFASFSTFFVSTLLMKFIDNNPFPLPFYYELRILPPISSWFLFSLNFLFIIVIALSILLLLLFLGIFEFSFVILLLAKLDCTSWTVRNIELMESFDEWIKEVTDSLSTCRYLLVVHRNVTSSYFYYMEKLNYACVLMFLVILNVDPKFIGISLAGMSFVACLGALVFMNELTLDRFEELQRSLYDLPWYEMKPTNRKKLLILIQSAQNPILLSSGGIRDMNLEWFSDIAKKSYSASLIIQDLMAS